jgi:hypothetical protein
MRAYKKAWRKRNRDKEREYLKNYRLKNPEKFKEMMKNYRDNNREKIKEWMRLDYLKHKEKRKKKVSEYQKKNKDKIREWKKHYLRGRRLKIIAAYGGKCVCCGEHNKEFLAIDHVNGDGKQDRLKYKSHQLHSIIIKENYPPRYRLLCHNCNSAIGFYGYCPHNGEKNGR